MRAGEATAVWVPDERHEAVRELTRARGAAAFELRAKCQQVSSMLLRLGRHYPGKTTWGKAHMAWLAGQKLEHLEQRIALEEQLDLRCARAKERIERLEQAIGEAVPAWSLARLATALMALPARSASSRRRRRCQRRSAILAGRFPHAARAGEAWLWSGAERVLHRRGHQTRPDHQGGQPAGARQLTGRMRLELSASATGSAPASWSGLPPRRR